MAVALQLAWKHITHPGYHTFRGKDFERCAAVQNSYSPFWQAD